VILTVEDFTAKSLVVVSYEAQANIEI